MKRQHRGLASALLAVSLLGGCRDASRGEQPLALRIEQVEVLTSRGRRVEVAAVEAALRAALDAPGGLEAEGREPRANRVFSARARLEELTGQVGQPVLRLTLVAVEGDDTFDAVVEVERRDRTLEMKEDVPMVALRAVAILEAKISLATLGWRGARSLLAADDPELVVLGLEWVEEAQAREVADDVAALLPHRDPRVAMGAVAALARVGSERHVEALIGAGRLADPEFAQFLYLALGRIGGARAEAFLQFAATNEEDPALARSAQRALRRISTQQAWASVAQPRRGRR